MRRTILVAAVFLGVAVTLTTEVLSTMRALNRTGLALAWLVVIVVGAGWLLAKRRHGSSAVAHLEERMAVLYRIGAADRYWAATLLALMGLVAGVAAIAVVAPPNTWDAMSYHMARVAHWIQGESIAMYASNSPPQVVHPPWAEYAIAHLQIMSGGDRLANLVSFAAYVGCIIGASLLARQLGSGRYGQLLAAALCASLPMAVLQASSAQNNLSAAFWVVCLAVFVLDEGSGDPTADGLLVGTSLGLAMLTKYTGYVYGLPFLLWFLWRVGRRRGWQYVLKRALPLLIVSVVVLNAGHDARVGATFVRALREQRPASLVEQGHREDAGAIPADQTPQAPKRLIHLENGRLLVALPVRYANQAWDPQALLSNVVRNLSLHMGTPIPALNALATGAINGLHRVIGASVNDPNTTYPQGYYRGVRFTMHEDDAGNPLHLVLILSLPVWLLLKPTGPERRRQWLYGGAIAAGFLLFCAVFKWMPWHSRLHVTPFVLGAPLAASVIDERWGRRTSLGLALIALAVALPWLFWGSPRPMLGARSVFAQPRSSQYFANRPGLEAPIRQIASMMQQSGCERIGLLIGGNDWEYPLWVLLGAEAGSKEIWIEHVGVVNFTRFIERTRPAFRPCAVYSTRMRDANIVIAGQEFRQAFSDKEGVLYMPW